MPRRISFQGFSLIQVSISLLIVGIISAIGLSQLSLMQKVYAARKTKANIDFVINALGVYYITNKSFPLLPYPSKINSDIGHQNKSMKDSFGIIPFKSLGIMEKFAKDGNGRWLLYKMNPKFGEFAFSPDMNRRFAFIIKSQNAKKEDEASIWYDLEKLNYLIAKLSHTPILYQSVPTLNNPLCIMRKLS